MVETISFAATSVARSRNVVRCGAGNEWSCKPVTAAPLSLASKLREALHRLPRICSGCALAALPCPIGSDRPWWLLVPLRLELAGERTTEPGRLVRQIGQ